MVALGLVMAPQGSPRRHGCFATLALAPRHAEALAMATRDASPWPVCDAQSWLHLWPAVSALPVGGPPQCPSRQQPFPAYPDRSWSLPMSHEMPAMAALGQRKNMCFFILVPD